MAACVVCGAEFSPIRKSNISCSAACRKERNRMINSAAWRRRGEDEKPPASIPCRECGALFSPVLGRRTYCGKECAKIAKRKRAASTAATGWTLSVDPFAAGLVRDWEGRMPDEAMGF